tara:strand:- start:2947 stop:3384 length:438 start_codon:yes stop_codon:yes gene_type:complete
MAKLYFTKDQPKSRNTCYGAMPDGESLNNENAYDVENITQEEYTNFITGVKTFNFDSGNIQWVDEAVCESKEDYDHFLQNLILNNEQMRIHHEHKEIYKSEAFETYINELKAIDSSSMSFPLATSARKDISTKCANYHSLLTVRN